MVEAAASGRTQNGKEHDMLKKFISTISVFTMILVLAPACAEQDNEAEAATSSKPATQVTAAADAAETTPVAAATDGALSIMDMPVNFSTPEDVEKSMEAVRQQAGEAAARDLTNAMGYILAYDLSLGRDQEKMYKKLNGRTPNAIIAKMKR
jgi:hypothetical protein